MKKFLAIVGFSIIILPALLAGHAALGAAAEPLHIDVLYMNHGPLQPTLKQMRTTFRSFGNKVQVAWHDFESKEGAAFRARKGISAHVPLEIWLGGKDTMMVGGKKVRFFGFPTGAGPDFFQGRWSLKDLDRAIANLITGK